MIENLVLFLKESVIPLGKPGVFLASFIEEVIAPIPSTAVLLLSGFLFLSGPFSIDLLVDLLWKIMLPASLGITLGSFLVYFLAFFLGKPFLSRWGRYLGVTWESIENVQTKFKSGRKDEFLLLIFRSIPVVPSVAINAFCGLVRFPLFSYTVITFLGSLFRAGILGLIGWKVGGLYEHYADAISIMENSVLIAILIAVAVFVVLKSFSKTSTS